MDTNTFGRDQGPGQDVHLHISLHNDQLERSIDLSQRGSCSRSAHAGYPDGEDDEQHQDDHWQDEHIWNENVIMYWLPGLTGGKNVKQVVKMTRSFSMTVMSLQQWH